MLINFDLFHLVLFCLCIQQDGTILHDEDLTQKYGIKNVGRAKDFIIKDLVQKDSELYHDEVEKVNLHNTVLNQADAEEAHLLPTDFKSKFKNENTINKTLLFQDLFFTLGVYHV